MTGLGALLGLLMTPLGAPIVDGLAWAYGAILAFVYCFVHFHVAKDQEATSFWLMPISIITGLTVGFLLADFMIFTTIWIHILPPFYFGFGIGIPWGSVPTWMWGVFLGFLVSSSGIAFWAGMGANVFLLAVIQDLTTKPEKRKFFFTSEPIVEQKKKPKETPKKEIPVYIAFRCHFCETNISVSRSVLPSDRVVCCPGCKRGWKIHPDFVECEGVTIGYDYKKDFSRKPYYAT
jgi:hypothetical protein